ncbi:MAG: hypothetical protein GF317_22475 [Candidatus Lokiarchaeota archaeon]|nr:hypothetical protein [Candidatus Lokiarchaeota archaeon]MBD3202227.1 hypothetical protein [Candidatus Lokiarchaeota archaeon]
MFSKQIHIVFNSNEESRITFPILEHSPNTLYYFTAVIRDTGQKDENLSFYEKNIHILRKKIPQLEIINREVDYTNYIEIIQEISKIIDEERKKNNNCKIYINISSGSKMTAVASIEASKLWNCEVYYVYSTLYDPSGDGPQHKGDMIIKTPITFPIKKPDEIYIKILKFISQLIEKRYKNKDYNETLSKFIYKKTLIQELYEAGYVRLETKNKDPRKLKSSKYMKSNKYLKVLERELNYIDVSDDRRNKKIYINEIGKEILKIFKYKI